MGSRPRLWSVPCGASHLAAHKNEQEGERLSEGNIIRSPNKPLARRAKDNVGTHKLIHIVPRSHGTAIIIFALSPRLLACVVVHFIYYLVALNNCEHQKLEGLLGFTS